MVHPDQLRVVDQSGGGTDSYLRCWSATRESYMDIDGVGRIPVRALETSVALILMGLFPVFSRWLDHTATDHHRARWWHARTNCLSYILYFISFLSARKLMLWRTHYHRTCYSKFLYILIFDRFLYSSFGERRIIYSADQSGFDLKLTPIRILGITSN